MAGDQSIDGAFRRILDAISDGVSVTDPDGTVVYRSAGAERITGYTAEDVVGHRCDEEIPVHADVAGSRLCVSGCPLQDCIDTGEEHSINEVFLERKDGERLAAYVDDPDDRAALARAAAAMYTAKHRGRDEFETSRGGESR